MYALVNPLHLRLLRPPSALVLTGIGPVAIGLIVCLTFGIATTLPTDVGNSGMCE